MGLRNRGVQLYRHPVQERVVRRRSQLRAIAMWLSDTSDGKDNVSLRAYCRQLEQEQGRKEGALYRGITKVLKEPAVQGKIQETLDEMCSRGLKVGTALLLERLENAGSAMETREIVSVQEYMARFKGKAFEKREEPVTAVAVQVNLPVLPDYSPEVRVAAKVGAKEALGDLVR